MPSTQGGNSPSISPRWLNVFVGLLVLASAAVITGRTVNFDEWLVLKASWLIAAEQNGNIPFLMPLTALMGWPTHAGFAPSALISGLRVGTFVLVFSCLWFAVRRHSPDQLTARLALALTLSSGAFFSHGFEFRYDVVILCCWLTAWGYAARPGTFTALWFGALAATLAAHHTKGLFYAAWLGLAAIMLPGPFKRHALSFSTGFALVGAGWVGWLIQQEQLDAAWEVYRQFAALGVEHERASAWASLQPRLAADKFWWALVIGAFASRLMRLHRSPPEASDWMILPPLLFTLLHPHPWDYLLAPLVPFLAMHTAREAVHRLSQWKTATPLNHWVGCGMLLVLTMWAQTAWHSWQARSAADLHTLDLAQQVMQRNDRVLDPTGALYMMQPPSSDWYRDTLWQHASAPSPSPHSHWSQATFIVASYRLRWVSPTWESALQASHRPACGWLWMRKDDARLNEVAAKCPSDTSPYLRNYWERAN